MSECRSGRSPVDTDQTAVGAVCTCDDSDRAVVIFFSQVGAPTPRPAPGISKKTRPRTADNGGTPRLPRSAPCPTRTHGPWGVRSAWSLEPTFSGAKCDMTDGKGYGYSGIHATTEVPRWRTEAGGLNWTRIALDMLTGGLRWALMLSLVVLELPVLFPMSATVIIVYLVGLPGSFAVGFILMYRDDKPKQDRDGIKLSGPTATALLSAIALITVPLAVATYIFAPVGIFMAWPIAVPALFFVRAARCMARIARILHVGRPMSMSHAMACRCSSDRFGARRLFSAGCSSWHVCRPPCMQHTMHASAMLRHTTRAPSSNAVRAIRPCHAATPRVRSASAVHATRQRATHAAVLPVGIGAYVYVPTCPYVRVSTCARAHKLRLGVFVRKRTRTVACTLHSSTLRDTTARFRRMPYFLGPVGSHGLHAPYLFLLTFRGTPTANADGVDRIGGWHRKGLGETRLWAPSERTRILGVRRRHAPRY